MKVFDRVPERKEKFKFPQWDSFGNPSFSWFELGEML